MTTNWCSCDGDGHLDGAARARTMTRRQALVGGALAAVTWAARGALADVAINPHEAETERDVLVTIFLRGGADGLNIVVPFGDDAYYRNRQTIGIAAPGDRRQGREGALDLDGFFGLHPALAPLHPLYKEGELAFVHACGSGDQTRSHFEAMNTVERGLPNQRASAVSGWLARHLGSVPGSSTSPLRAVAFSSIMPDSLRGATDASALNSLADFALQVPASLAPREASLRRALAEIYRDDDAIARAGHETLKVLKTLNTLDPAQYRPAHGATYPTGELGVGLRQVAILIKGRIGLEVACLDRGGWDTHVAQGGAVGWLGLQLEDVGSALAAFARDLGPEMKRVTVLVMSEFGRRVRENSGLGTDHGRAGMMMLLGGGIHGGKVFARWPGLEDDQLEAPGDLRVTTDYRDVLAEVLARRLRNPHFSAVFPGYKPAFPGVAKAQRPH